MPDTQRGARGSPGAAALILVGLACAPLAARAQAAQGSATGRQPSKMMAPDSAPAFDVASIKPANPAARPGRVQLAILPTISTGPATLSSRSATVKDLIAAAYGIETYQVFGGPPWLESDRFEVLAKSDKPASRDQLLLMLRPLLKDRCKLAFHTETKEMRVYALTASKNVSLQRPLTPSEAAKPTLNHLVRNWDMPALARYLTRFGADMPVIDRTGLSGEFSLDLDMDSVVSAAYQNNGAAPTNENMFDATVEMIEHQTGLKLVPTSAPVEMLVIDHVDRPSAN